MRSPSRCWSLGRRQWRKARRIADERVASGACDETRIDISVVSDIIASVGNGVFHDIEARCTVIEIMVGVVMVHGVVILLLLLLATATVSIAHQVWPALFNGRRFATNIASTG